MNKLDEARYSEYWLDLFEKACPQSSIDEWEGIEFYKVAEAAKTGDKSAREYIFWKMKDVIESTFSKNRKRVKAWSDKLGLSDDENPNRAGALNQTADNWISASWIVIFEGYPITNNNTVGPFIKYVSKERGLDYLTWVFSVKAGSILYAENNLESSGGVTVDSKRKVSGVEQDTAAISANNQVGGGDHSISREMQDDFKSDFLTPEEEFELKDNLESFRAFTKDADLNEKKNGFSPMIAFKTVILNMDAGENSERNVANLANRYDVSRNTFANYAREAASVLTDDYDVSLSDLQNLIKRYGATALGRMIKESSFIPTPLTTLNESYDFRLLESIFTGKVSLKESYIRIAECPRCGAAIEETDYEDYTCPECGKFYDHDDLEFHDMDDEFQDGAPDTHFDDILSDLSESINLKEHKNPFEAIAKNLCESFTKDIDFDNDDNAMEEASKRIVEFIDSLIEESMQYFPVDVYEPELYDIWQKHEKRHI